MGSHPIVFCAVCSGVQASGAKTVLCPQRDSEFKRDVKIRECELTSLGASMW